MVSWSFEFSSFKSLKFYCKLLILQHSFYVFNGILINKAVLYMVKILGFIKVIVISSTFHHHHPFFRLETFKNDFYEPHLKRETTHICFAFPDHIFSVIDIIKTLPFLRVKSKRYNKETIFFFIFYWLSQNNQTNTWQIGAIKSNKILWF